MTGFRITAVVTAALSVAACKEPFGWGRANVDGEWIYQAEAFEAEGVTCEATGLRLLIDQDENDFSGIVSGGTLTCIVTVLPEDTAEFGVDTAVSRSMDGVPVTNGRLYGKSIRFQIGAGGLRHDGEIVSRSMSGDVVLSGGLIDVDADSIGGSFAASKVRIDEEE